MIWLRWPRSHAVISTLISLVAFFAYPHAPAEFIPVWLTRLDVLAFGAIFYAGRELVQWQLHPDKWFDERGFWWGVGPMGAVWLVVRGSPLAHKLYESLLL